MICKNCGFPLKSDDQFCPNCGNKVASATDIIEITDEVENNNEVTSSIPEEAHVEEEKDAVVKEKNVQVNPSKDDTEKVEDWKSITSFIIGILSIIFAFAVNIFVLPLAIFGLIIGILSKQKGAFKIIGIILNILAIISSIIVIFVLTAISMGAFDTNYFEGDGFKYQYNYEWRESKLTDGKRVLQFNGTNAFLSPVAREQLTSSITCDYSLDSCKESYYDYIYDSMLLGIDDESIKLEKTDTKYKLLKDDIYYSMIDINQSSNITGRYYILISKNKDVALTFIVSVKNSNISILHDKVIETLSNIEIEERDYEVNDTTNTDGDSQIIGSELLGYISLPNDWTKDSIQNNSVQYHSNTSYVIKMGVYDDRKSPKEYSIDYASNMEKDGAINVTTSLVKLSNYVAYKVYGYYENDSKNLLIWFFEPEDKKTHYILMEGPEQASSNYNIPHTFKLQNK